MKALTVLPPWSHAIAHLGKSVENRSWPTTYRGPLLIHAGKSVRCWDDPGTAAVFHAAGVPLPLPRAVTFGAMVAVARVADCLRANDAQVYLSGSQAGPPHPWVEGPWCWLLADIRPLAEPVPCRGAQQLWEPPADVLAAVLAQLGGRPAAPPVSDLFRHDRLV